MSALVDTDLLIDGLHGSASVLALLEELAPSGLAISLISLAELFRAATRSPNHEVHVQAVHDFFKGYRVFSLTEDVRNRFAQERATLQRRGLFVPASDLYIASTALVFELTLFTHNRQRFEHIQGLQILP